MKIHKIVALLGICTWLIACGTDITEQPDQPVMDDPIMSDKNANPNNEPEEPFVQPTDDDWAYPPPDRDSPIAYPAPAKPDQQQEPDLGDDPTNLGFSPQPGDDEWKGGGVYIDATEIILLESFPVQVRMELSGHLPTPCHELRLIVSPPDDHERIEIEAYSVSDPELMCIQSLAPFDAQVALGDFTEGEFTVWINGEQVGEFNLP